MYMWLAIETDWDPPREHAMHERFAHLALGHEWFRGTRELYDYIESLRPQDVWEPELLRLQAIGNYYGRMAQDAVDNVHLV